LLTSVAVVSLESVLANAFERLELLDALSHWATFFLAFRTGTKRQHCRLALIIDFKQFGSLLGIDSVIIPRDLLHAAEEFNR
jgi:hypothetical protein